MKKKPYFTGPLSLLYVYHGITFHLIVSQLRLHKKLVSKVHCYDFDFYLKYVYYIWSYIMTVGEHDVTPW